jgi:hypothetical protein
MTLQAEYTGTARRTQEAWATAADVWTENIQKVTDQVPTSVLPVVPTDATAVVEQWFDFTDRIAQANREYVLTLAGVVDTLGGAVRQHVDAVGEAVRDQIQAVSHTAKEQVDKVAAAEREAIEVTGRKQIEATERAEAAGREKARERYEGRTKAELVEELGQRDLPKTGTVDELIDRLVDADSK